MTLMISRRNARKRAIQVVNIAEKVMRAAHDVMRRATKNNNN